MLKMTLTVSELVCDEIDRFARRHGISKTEALRRILSLVKVANQAASKGLCLGVIATDAQGQDMPVAKIVGV